jgi:hypothetical protein
LHPASAPAAAAIDAAIAIVAERLSVLAGSGTNVGPADAG